MIGSYVLSEMSNVTDLGLPWVTYYICFFIV